ncbi:MAG: hypothetical protein JWM47_1532 [Acidimicrobiales bacterium]|nr:hypothetical protein [Acidimicrobiales bacterium]
MDTLSTAATVRGRVLASTDRFWHPEDFEAPTAAVLKALTRLVAAGELRRMRRGLYWRGRRTPLGIAPPPAERLARELVDEPGTGPAGLAAALALGLTTQVARHETIAVPGRAPRPVAGIRFVSREAAWRRRDERLRPIEVALLEVLRVWPDVVEVSTGAAVSHLARLTAGKGLDLKKVVRASKTEPPVVRDRLRTLLRLLDRSEDADEVRPSRTSMSSDPVGALA